MSARTAAAAVLLFALGASGLHAEGSPPVLGRAGNIYQVSVGAYGDLFPGGGAASAAAEVLRLEVRRAAGDVENHLVPGSESDDTDRMPSLSFDASSGKLYVVWSSSNALTLSRISLASFDGSEWSETIEVSGNIYSKKSAPRLAVTHDRFELAGGAAGESSNRTILHVVWSEETPDGERAMYAPVVLIDGELASTLRRVHWLNEYLPDDLRAHPPGGAPSEALLMAPTVDSGSESNAVVVGFADSESGSLVQLEISTPATELAELADSLAEHIDASGLCRRITAEGRGAISGVASSARHHIVIVGRRIRSRVRTPLAKDVEAFLKSRSMELCASGGIRGVSNGARHHIVIVGARAQEGELLEGAVVGQSHVLLTATQPIDNGQIHHLARLQIRSQRVAPTIGEGEPTIFVSPRGTGAVIVWDSGDTVAYIETDGDEGWSQTWNLQLGPTLSRTEAYSALRARARSLE